MLSLLIICKEPRTFRVADEIDRFVLRILSVLLFTRNKVRLRRLLHMCGMRNTITGGLKRERYSRLLEISKLRGVKYGRMHRSNRFWIEFSHVLFWFSLCAFILTLGPDIFWMIAPDGTPEISLSTIGRTALNKDNSAYIQTRSLTSSSLLELKMDTLHDSNFSSTKRGVTRHTIDKNEVQATVLGQGQTNPLELSVGLKIFVYDLPPQYNEVWLTDARCSSHLFAAEVAIHQILVSSPIRTLNAIEADFFFVPVYVSCNFSTNSGFPSLGHARVLLQSATNLISHEMPYWNRSQGRDHIFVATHDYGACFHAMEDLAVAAGIPYFLRKSIILQTFGRRDSHPCQNVEHIQIPPYVSPSSVQQFWVPPAEQRRDIWAFFRGKMEIHPKNISGRVYSRGIRAAIWKKFGRDKRFYIKRKHSTDYQLEIRRSVFCLCPLGWAPWSPRIVEAVVFGCVPVIIADKSSLPFSHVINWSQISVSVRERDVGKLGRILMKVSRTNLTSIQRNLWREQYRRALLYTQPISKGDATWQILELLTHKLNRSFEV